MADPVVPPALDAGAYSQAWRHQAAWRVLDTEFDAGLNFLRTWRAWKDDAQRPGLLHYVAVTAMPGPANALLASAADDARLRPLANELRSQWFGLLPGFHRLVLDSHRVLLTLCVGELNAMLRQQQFHADAVYLNLRPSSAVQPSPWSHGRVKALARCCRRGTTVVGPVPAADLLKNLTECGFEIRTPCGPADASGNVSVQGQFNPAWPIRTSRDPAVGLPIKPTSCAVIGAGLAGASVAAALALRGWQVQVLDQGDAPASGASGLPVGLMAPHVSVDDCALSRLSRSGIRLTLQQARDRLRQGLDWAPSGALERRLEGPVGLPADWPTSGREWSCEAPAGFWHPSAAWLKPASLVRAWLADPEISFLPQARVAAVRRHADSWDLLDSHGRRLASANRVILANATGARPLLEALQWSPPLPGLRTEQLPALQSVRGQLSWALHAEPSPPVFAPYPMNGAGSVIPAVPIGDAAGSPLAWFVGSTFLPEDQPTASVSDQHALNFSRLQQLAPEMAQVLEPQFAGGALNAWSNSRCVSADRLPVVGSLHDEVDASLWICAGMGARGLSFATLCAELLAAQWGAEPLPLEARLARLLVARRGRGATGTAR